MDFVAQHPLSVYLASGDANTLKVAWFARSERGVGGEGNEQEQAVELSVFLDRVREADGLVYNEEDEYAV